MSVEDLFGINSWLLQELKIKELERGLNGELSIPSSIIGFLKGQQDNGWTVTDSASAGIERMFDVWLSDRLWLLGDLSPLEFTRKFFPRSTPEELAESFLREIGFDLVEQDITNRLVSTAAKYEKSYAIRFGEITPDQKKFLTENLYSNNNYAELRDHFLRGSLRAQLLEEFLHRRYVGQKRFSVEGLEGFIGSLEVVTLLAARANYERVVLGMAHRGRLSALHIWAGLPLTVLTAAFEKNIDLKGLLGDVKYHWGVSNERHVEGRKIYVDLLPNPSHLESINPVLSGYLRGMALKEKSLGIIAHGNSALCGQGVNQELLNFVGIRGFETPPIIHFVLDNLVGFTAGPDEEKSTVFSSDIFLSFGIPVILVNATDFDASLKAVAVAFAYADRFHKDVVVHLFGYRKYGHNEGDDPTVTQPVMYEEIRGKKPAPSVYIEKWGYGDSLVDECSPKSESVSEKQEVPILYTGNKPSKSPSIDSRLALKLAEFFKNKLAQIDLQPKVQELFDRRIEALTNKGQIDWGLGELLVYAAAMEAGYNVRLVGEDSRRGTFAHRHAYVWSRKSGEPFCVLDEFAGRRFEAYNSTLSEYGSLAFESGFSLAAVNTFCLWEAQFGDFVNGAQIVLDQFLSSSMEKWGISFPITLLLPHGQEGAGPEHSSARVERFLQLSAGQNWRIVQPSNVASYVAALLSQVTDRRPCIILTPKSLLRASASFANLSDLTDAKLQPFRMVRRGGTSLLICSGKIYYKLVDLLESNNLAADILCLEQLYPIDDDELANLVSQYRSACIVQEEPENQGIGSWLREKIYEKQDKIRVHILAHPESATTAVGVESLFEERQRNLFQELQKHLSTTN